MTANATITGSVPNVSSTGPATKIPSGCRIVQVNIMVGITIGRRAGGTRSVMVACNGGLTIPFAIPETASAPA
jgi:hypothetical protein